MRQTADSFPCSFSKACNVLWAVDTQGWSQTKAANAFSLLGGSLAHPVSRVWKGYWQRSA